LATVLADLLTPQENAADATNGVHVTHIFSSAGRTNMKYSPSPTCQTPQPAMTHSAAPRRSG